MYSFVGELFGSGSAYGTYARTSTALDALVCVDDHLAVLLTDRLYGTFALASAASDAFIGNLVCHDRIPPTCFVAIVSHYAEKVKHFSG